MQSSRVNAKAMFVEHLGDKIGKNMEIAIFNWAVKSCRKEDLAWKTKKESAAMIKENGSIQFANTNRPAGFRFLYTMKVRSIYANLRKYHRFKELLASQTIHPKIVPFMKPFEIDNTLWKPIFDKNAAKELAKARWEEEEQGMSGLYVCKKCKSDKTAHVSVQTRSADEPMTVYITCKICKHNWKE
jgi:transcription elongation factor S-II